MTLQNIVRAVTAIRLAALAAVLAALAALGLTACDTGPECLDYSTQWVTGTHIVNGRAVPWTHTVTVCTRYADSAP